MSRRLGATAVLALVLSAAGPATSAAAPSAIASRFAEAGGVKFHPEADRVAYTAAYARPGRMHASWSYFASFPKTAEDFAALVRTPLTMPVLVIAGEVSRGDLLVREMKLAATNVKDVLLKGSGHWVMEERPQETMDAIWSFLQ